MLHRTMSVWALVAAGALVVTTVSAAPSYADDTGANLDSSVVREGDSSAVTIIVHLEEEAGDQATRFAEAKKRITQEVTRTIPGASVEALRDYTHAFEGFALRAPRTALAAIRATQGVRGAFVEGSHEPVTDPDFWDYNHGSGSFDSSPALGAASRMTGAAAARQDGRGQVVEVIDTGVDTSHEAFSGAMDASSQRYTRAALSSLIPSLGAGKDGAWLSDKIPFAYDYGDGDADASPASGGGWSSEQGTHVAALATANGAAFRGAAPASQLIVAKVNRDGGYAAYDSALLAALDDAAVLGPDTIAVSFATLEGMSTDSVALYSQVYQKLSDMGIAVNAPAGNDGKANNASDPDQGLLGFPAFYPSTLAAASVGEQEILDAVSFGQRQIAYRAVTRTWQEDGPGLNALPDGNYRVLYAGNGTTADLEKYLGPHYGDLSHTILLEEWSGTDESGDMVELTTQLANLEALASRPAGLMIADTRDLEVPGKAQVDRSFSTPTGTITKADRDALRAAIDAAESSSVEVSVSRSNTLTVPAKVHVSGFSGTGATYDLRLKPEIAAPGGDVMSAISGNHYGRMSGTAQAAGQIAGIAALVRQRIASDPAFSAMSAAERNSLVTNFLMGTAHPIVDAELNDGTYYSPRRVGAGLVDAVGATTSPVYPTVVGATNPSRPKADLGDGTDGWTFQVRLTNVSNEALSYTLDGQALAENVNRERFTNHSTDWAGRGIDLTFSASSVTVPAASSTTVSVTVTPRAEFASFAQESTPKGTFIDGAVTFKSADGHPDLTVPYMGFYGSWGGASIFDQQTPGNHLVGFGSTLMSGNLPFGQFNPFEMEDERALGWFDPERFVITRSVAEGARTNVTPGTILLRAVPSLTYTVTNDAGQTVRSYTCDRADKAFYDDHWRAMHNAEFMSPGCDPNFDTYDAKGRELPDGRYTVTIEASTYGPSSTTQQTGYSFWVDTQAPVIENVRVVGEGESRTLSFDVTDASPIAGYGFKSSLGGELTLWAVEEDPSRRGDDGLFHEHYEANLSSVLTALGGDPATIELRVWDWTVNARTATVAVKPIAMTSLSVSPESATLKPGETVTLSVSHEPADANATDVVWSSSDEAVATVSDSGVVTAVGAGEATITASDPTQPSVSASAAVRVKAPAPKTGQWKHDGVRWWYRYEDGSYPRGTALVIDGVTYRFDAEGYMRTGWVKEDGAWYYHTSSGAQASGWVAEGGRWYYLDPASGAMVTGWVRVGSTWYYLMPSSGAMATGWLAEGGHWYYLRAGSGAMVTGWERIWGRWYHFAESGQLIG